MLKDTLETYRTERKAFVLSLKNYYGIDFYKLDVQERTGWFATFLLYKREFFDLLKKTKEDTNLLKENAKYKKYAKEIITKKTNGK